jgi:hypothetical protein
LTSGSLPDLDAVVRWVRGAGPAPAAQDLRAWLQSLVPEYRASR